MSPNTRRLPRVRTAREIADSIGGSFPGEVSTFIATVRGRYRLYGVLTMLVVVAATGLGLVLAEIVADRVLVLPMHHRTFLLRAMLVAIAGLGSLLALGYFLGSRSDLRVGLWIERKHPQLKAGLVSLIEMWRPGKLSSEELELRGLIGDRVSNQLEAVDPDEVVGLENLKTGLKVLTGASAVFALYAVLSSSTFFVGLSRVLFPMEGTLPPTATRVVEVRPGNGRSLRNELVEIIARMEGVKPPSASVHISEDGSTWRSLPLHPVQGRLWTRVIEGLDSSIVYQITAGDTRSDEYAITVLEPPLVGSVKVEVVPPEYSGLEPFTSETGSVSALVGSRLTIVASTSKPPARDLRGRLKAGMVAPGRRRPMDLRGDKLVTEIELTETTSYHVEFTDSAGYTNAKPVRYTLTALPDMSPEVSILSPDDGTEVPPHARLEVKGRARDDFGLAKVVLSYQAGFKPWETVVIQARRGGRNEAVAAWLDLGPLGLSPGAAVTYYLSAEDNRSPRANRADSERRVIRVRAARAWERPPEEELAGGPADEEAGEEGRGAAEGDEGDGGDPAAEREELAELIRKLAKKLKDRLDEGEMGEEAEADANMLEELARALERLADEADEEEEGDDEGDDSDGEDGGDDYEGLDRDPGEEDGQDEQGGAPDGEGGQGEPDEGEAQGPAEGDADGQGTPSNGEGDGQGEGPGRGGRPGGDGGPQSSGDGESGNQGRPGGEGGRPQDGSGEGQGQPRGAGEGQSQGPGRGEGEGLGRGPGRGDGQGRGQGQGQGQAQGARGGGAGNPGGGGAGEARGGGGEGVAGTTSDGRRGGITGDVRGMAGRLRESADGVRRGEAEDAEYDSLKKIAEELSDFGRRLRAGEIDRLAEMIARRRRAAEGEAAPGESPDDGHRHEASSTDGPLGPDGAASRRVRTTEDRRPDEEGRTADDSSRLAPEFRRLYEAYTRSLSEDE